MIHLTRLSKERIQELQQQIEDLQKSLQEQGSKSEGESVSNLEIIINSAVYGLSVISLEAQINLVFEGATLIIEGTLKYRIYLHNRCND